MRVGAAVLILSAVVGCVGIATQPDAGLEDAGFDVDAGASADAGRSDGGDDAAFDAGVSENDAGPDGGANDGGNDAGATDAGTDDAGGPDAGARDAGAPDAGPLPPLSPQLVRFERIATDPEVGEAPSGAPGNSWGGHQSRLVRLSTGALFAAYLVSPTSGTDPSQAQWVLLRRGPLDADGWTEVGRRRCGREPMHLLRLPDDSLLILSWPTSPATWTVSTGATSVISGPSSIPGGWEQLLGSSTPYSAAGVAVDGSVCFFASRGVAGTVSGVPYTADSAWDFACRSPTGTWGPMTTLNIGLRYCYGYVLPRSDGSWILTATRDVQWAAAGYTQPAGSFGYVFNAVDRWVFASSSATSPQARTELGRLEPTSGPQAVMYQVGDSIIDREGQHRTLTRSRTSNDVWQLRQVAFDGGTPVATNLPPINFYTDGIVRLMQDDYGRDVMLFAQSTAAYLIPVGPGFTLGTRVDLGPTIFAGGRTIAGPYYLATPRGGTPFGREVDFLLDLQPASGSAELYYGRIRLY